MSQSASAPSSSSSRRDWILAGTVLLSAWLLFQVQPMVSKRILPWFGGGPAVWTTAMLFFQGALLAGYFYAHLSNKAIRPRAQALVHAGLLLLAVLALIVNGVIAGDQWKPAGNGSPTWQILVTLAATVGLPYLMLSATAPLVQTWFGRTNPGRSPYRLYALSNFGSLAALVTYPIIVEPLIGLSTQALIWSCIFGAFAVLCIVSGLSASGMQLPLPPGEGRGEGSPATAVPPHPALSQGERVASPEAGWGEGELLAPAPPDAEGASTAAPTLLNRFHWLALPACASVVLLASTNYLCQDIASLPLLWIAPLAVYLVTFIIAFDADRWYVRWAWMAALAATSFAACWSWDKGLELDLVWQIAIHLALMLAVGMVCHGEVARMRPGHNYLTSYYLHLSAGGAIGGLLVAVVAPLVLKSYYEFPLGVLAAWLLSLSVLASDKNSPLFHGKQPLAWLGLIALTAFFAWKEWVLFGTGIGPSVATSRNFFGVLKVQTGLKDGEHGEYRRLKHGRITHGMQFTDESRRREATAYYSPESGVGQAIASRPDTSPRHVGVVGLGAGTLAAYADKGDVYRFYDIDPQVVKFANEYFTYLGDARDRGADVSVVIEDARLALEREAPKQFDVLVLDAFSGDAIPVHLLTLEAFAMYKKVLRDDGILAVHITNRQLDLAPVVQAAADHNGFDARLVSTGDDDDRGLNHAWWVLLTPADAAKSEKLIGRPITLTAEQARIPAWTDDFTSIWSVYGSEIDHPVDPAPN